MYESINNLIESIACNKEKKEDFKKVIELFSNLRFCYNVDEMAHVICNWVKKTFQVKNIYFNLYNISKNNNCILVTKGKKFTLEEENSFYFIIDTKTDFNALVAFQADDTKTATDIRNNQGLLDSVSLLISPMVENTIMKKLYIDSASIDSVTNVYTREYLLEHLNSILKLKEDQQNSITFLMIGIDRFKAVIDEFNHDIGNVVLKELAKVIHTNITNNDIVARVIGDEFLVALLNSSEKKTLKVVRNIIRIFGHTHITVNNKSGQTLTKSICVGISSYPDDSNDINQVIKNADTALYIAKEKQRGSYEIYKQVEESSIDLF
ncbi:MAG: GGDEF domain-containing protein [Arcobacteraceae bacterium]|nr:GGDEF domain-containing protein [Arcobacteraceae bacterium]